jgi:hypothetical protein
MRSDWIRLCTAARLALLAGLFWSGCSGESEPLRLGGETNWLAWCESDEQCPVGECVCGVCTAPCTAELPSCAAGPPESACFADGSFGHAALCSGEASGGICLPVCAASTECPEGTTCAAGACLPSPAESSGSDPEPTGSVETDEALAALGQFSQEWLGELFDGRPWPLPRYVDLVCPPPPAAAAACPTLEQLLSGDGCLDVRAGCGLIYVGSNAGLGGENYWYDSFGSPPVARYNWSDVSGEPVVAASRPIDCDAIDSMCSTCGRDAPRCEDLPGVFPEPPTPAPVPGCTCEPDDVGGARVSMDCFCSLYGCPTYAELALACTEEVPADIPPNAASIDACGQVWLSTGEFMGQRFAFDAETGVLVGASASRDAPLAAPCGTYRVSAGAASDCAEVARCYCYPNGDNAVVCADAAWLDP